MFLPVYFFLAMINLRAKLTATPTWRSGLLEQNHEQLLAFEYFNNEQSRLLQYMIPETFHLALGVSIPVAYLLQRWLFTFLTFVFFHHYLRHWFDRLSAFAGVAFLAAVMPLTYRDHLQESAALLSLTFLLALWAIRDHNTWLLLGAFAVGSLNNETIMVVPLAYFFYNLKESRLEHLLTVGARAVLLSLPLWIGQGTMRMITRDRPHLGGSWHLPGNVKGIIQDLQRSFVDWPDALHLFFLFVFGALWIYAFLHWKDKPLFLRRAAWIIPPFLLAHLLTGRISEPRQMLPLGILIIPMALFTLRDAAQKEKSGFRG